MSRTLIAGLCLAIATSPFLIAPTAASAAAGPVETAPSQPSRRCVTDHQTPCKTAKQYHRAFKDGDLGKTPYSKSKFSKKFKTLLRQAVVKKGLIPPISGSPSSRGSYKYSGWGDYWDAFNNALDCVAPGAEDSCKKDFDKIKPLEDPAKVIVGCGGLAVAAFYTGGAAVPATAALSGGLVCSWGLALSAW